MLPNLAGMSIALVTLLCPWSGSPVLFSAGNQSCTQYLFPMQTHGRFMQQSITVLWVSFSLCFLKIHYVHSAFLTATEYQVSIFMEVFILTPRHGSSPATARSEPSTAYGCEDLFSSSALLGLRRRWISSAVLPGSHSVPDVPCNCFARDSFSPPRTSQEHQAPLARCSQPPFPDYIRRH